MGRRGRTRTERMGRLRRKRSKVWDWGWILGGDVCLSDDDDDDEDEYRCRKEEIGLVCLCGNEKIWPALGGGLSWWL